MSYIHGSHGAVEREEGASVEDESVWDNLDKYKVVLKEKGSDLLVVAGDEETSIRNLTSMQLNNPTMRDLILNWESTNSLVNVKIRDAINRAGWRQGESVEY